MTDGCNCSKGQFRRGWASLTSSLLRIRLTFFFYKIDQKDLESLHMILSTECSTVTDSMGQLEAWVGEPGI